MRGHVHKRVHKKKNGDDSVLYYAVVELPRADGKRRSDWGEGFRRKKDADSALNEKLALLGVGQLVQRSNLSVTDCLRAWMDAVDDTVKPTTRASYQKSVDLYLVPHIGALKLRSVDIQNLSKRLLRSGGRRKPKRSSGTLVEGAPLAAKTVRNHLGVLGAALKYAVGMGWIPSNPMAAVKKPSARRTKEMTIWGAEEVATFLSATESHPLSPLFHLALYTGARRGELLGLRWNDVDLARGRIAVRQNLVLVDGVPTFGTPKSHEARTVDLDESTVSVLRRWQSDQRGQLDGVKPFGDLVFTRADGSPLRPDTVSHWFRKAVEESTVDRRISFHEMRHTHASLLLSAGVAPHVVSQRLGHADIGPTRTSSPGCRPMQRTHSRR
jgi:integrase